MDALERVDANPAKLAPRPWPAEHFMQGGGGGQAAMAEVEELFGVQYSMFLTRCSHRARVSPNAEEEAAA